MNGLLTGYARRPSALETEGDRRLPHRRLLCVLGAIVFGFSTVAVDASALTWKEAEIAIKPASAAGNAVAEFRFQNTGTTAIGVIAVRPSCDCLSAKADKVGYAPGESGMIRAEFALAGREGRQEKTIAVTTDDAPDKPTVLKLTVDIPEPMAVRPRFVFWRLGEAAGEKEIEVVLAEPKAATLGEVLCTEPTFGARLVGPEATGHYRVKVTPASTTKLAQATIRLNATVGGQPRVFVLYAAVK